VGACAVAALPLARGSELVGRIDVRVSAVAIVVLTAAMVLNRPRLVAISLALLGAGYAIYLAVDGVSLDSSAPAVAAGLLVTAELAYWSVEERERIRAEQGDALRRVAVIAALGIATLVVSASLLFLAEVVHARGLAVDLIGAAAAASTLALVAVLARSTRRT